MRWSATHRMPPAKKSSSQHVNKKIPIFVLWATHIERRQRHIHMSSFCCKISFFAVECRQKQIRMSSFWWKDMVWRIVKVDYSSHTANLYKSNLMRGHRAHSALCMYMFGFLPLAARYEAISGLRILEFSILSFFYFSAFFSHLILPFFVIPNATC